MSRKPRRVSGTGIHHVMNRGAHHQPVFFADEDRVEFVRLLREVHERFGVEIVAYCLMGNHFHLLVREVRGGLSEAMQYLLGVYTRHTNDRVGRDGPLFRGRFHSIPVETDPYLLSASRYIHRNPLELATVDDIARYRWSSYRAYLGHRPAPEFLNTAVLLEYFEHDRSRLAHFTDDPVEQRSTATMARIAGSGAATLDELHEIVACALALDDLRHGAGTPVPSRGLGRTVSVLLARRLPDGPLRTALLDELDFASSKFERRAVQRAEQRRRAVPAVDRALGTVQQYLEPEARAA